MDARDYRSYCGMYGAILQALRPPDLLIYLRASLPTLRARIARRGRPFESAIEDAYLARLNRLYDAWIEAYTLSPKIIINADLDFVGCPADLERVLAELEPRGLTLPILP